MQGKYLTWYSKKHNGKVIAVAYQANNSLCIYDKKYPFVFEDIILPFQPGVKCILPFRTKKLSPVNKGTCWNVLPDMFNQHKACHIKGSFSKKTAKKRNGERNRFLRMGGEIIDICTLPSDTIADEYIRLFNLRWKGAINCFKKERLVETLDTLRTLLFGYILYIDGKIVALDLIFKAESKPWVYMDDINGGYDPNYNHLSVGSVLLWENICRAKDYCNSNNKELIFSLGSFRKEWDYKKAWCDIKPLGRVLI